MAKYQLLTRNAADAIDWVMSRLPDRGFEDFQREMELVMQRTMQRYGVTPDVISGFSVDKFIADRDPVTPAVFGTMYNHYGDVYLLPDDLSKPPLKLHDDGLWYPAAAHMTRSAIASVGGGKSPARATKLGDPAKGEKTPRSYFLMGDLYRCGTTREIYALCGGKWYKPGPDDLWVKLKDLPMGSHGYMAKEQDGIKFEVTNEFYQGE